MPILGNWIAGLRQRTKAAAFELVRRYHRLLPDFTEVYAGSPRKPGPIFRKDTQLLFALTRLLMPKSIVEIGVGGAASTIAFTEALRLNRAGGHVVSVDTEPRLIDRARRLLGVHGLARFSTIVRGLSTDPDTRRRVAELAGVVDLLLIDGDHSFDGARGDFELYRDLVAPSGVIVFHDTGPLPLEHSELVERLPREESASPPVRTADGKGIYHRPDVARAIDWILEHHPEYAVLSLHTCAEPCCGLAVLQKRQPLYQPEGADDARP